jgi:branched-chain amino acid transport system substrate-binding protein
MYLPGVSWLPTLYQNPTNPSIVWKPINWKTILIVAGVISGGLLLTFIPHISKYISNLTPDDPRVSICDKILIKSNNENDLAQAGIKACKEKNFPLAQEKFAASLQQQKNNPEIVIYKNNAASMSRNPLKLAVVVPITNLNIAQEILRGVAQAQEEINKQGGINGRFLNMTIVNDDNDEVIAKIVAQKLVEDTDIIAVIGHNASNVSLKAAPIYQEGELVMVTPTSFADGITDVGKYIFRVVPSVEYMAQPLVQYIQHKNPKTVLAICYDTASPDGLSFYLQFTKALNAALNAKDARIGCDLNTPGFKPRQAIKEANNSGADSLLIIPFIEKLDRAYELAKANQGKFNLFGNSTFGTFTTLENGRATQGLTIVVPWSSKSPKNKPFADSAKRFWGGDISWRTAGAYDATYAVATGLKTAKNRKTLQEVLGNQKPPFSSKTINGEVKFLPNRDRVGKPIILQVQPDRSHQTGYDFKLISSE